MDTRLHQTIVAPDISFSSRYSILNNTIKNENGEKVAWRTPSFFLTQYMVGLNVYNMRFPLDFGVRVLVEKNMLSYYKEGTNKEQAVINRYWQINPGIYVKLKLGNYVRNYKYWTVYLEMNRSFNFAFKKKEMNFRYKGFDPFNNEFNIFHGLANNFNQGPFGKTFNKAKEVMVNKDGAFLFLLVWETK